MPSPMPRFKSSLRLLASTLVGLAVLAAPSVVLACAVCMSGRDDETELAFRVSTGLMTLLPFVLVGSLGLWLRKRFREVAEEEARLAAERAARRSPRTQQAATR
jgi:hypothetical protein